MADVKHGGFKRAAASVQRREDVSPEAARAIIAAGALKASAKAQRANPALKKVTRAQRTGGKAYKGK